MERTSSVGGGPVNTNKTYVISLLWPNRAILWCCGCTSTVKVAFLADVNYTTKLLLLKSLDNSILSVCLFVYLFFYLLKK